MIGFSTNLEKDTLENTNFRKVIFTAPHSQLVLMCLQPKEDIGIETHDNVDQFFRVERGTGRAILNGAEYDLTDGSCVVIPAGTEHNIINLSDANELKVYTIYSPANHPDGTIHKNKKEAIEYELNEQK
jgi:mannose-6-phosphate isomerase-like protein (cupin superfamily)